jgi:2-iminobutanoate/2-iminopropanoate deaminase
MRKAIHTEQAPRALGPYSQAVLVGSTLYVSGQLGLDPSSGRLVEGGAEAQARQALLNIRAILSAAGFSMRDVVLVQLFLADLGDFAAVNEVYKSFFEEPYPARAAVQAAALPGGGKIEIWAIAQKSGGSISRRLNPAAVRLTEHPFEQEDL